MLRVPKCNSIGKFLLQLLADAAEEFQEQDTTMVYFCWKDGSKVSNLTELPKKLVDFKDDWSNFAIHSWKNTIFEGKTQT